MAELTDEHLTGLFADLRTGELHRVRPPGTAAIRSTVRRRHVRRSVTTGAAAAVAGVTAAGMAGLLPLGGPWQEPLLSQQVLTARRDLAAGIIGINPNAAAPALSDRLTLATVQHTSHPMVAGVYVFTMSCVGTGIAKVVFRKGELANGAAARSDDTQVVGSATVACRISGSSQSTEVTLAGDDHLSVDVDPDEDAARTAGFAYRAEMILTSRVKLRRDAASALGLPTDDQTIDAHTYFMESVVDDDHSTLSAGRYRLEITCLGAGSVNVEVRLSSAGSETTRNNTDVPCRRPAGAGGLSFTVAERQADTPMAVTIVPHGAAIQQAATALRVIEE